MLAKFRYWLRVRILAINTNRALVHALTAWHDTGWGGEAERWVNVSDLHDVTIARTGEVL